MHPGLRTAPSAAKPPDLWLLVRPPLRTNTNGVPLSDKDEAPGSTLGSPTHEGPGHTVRALQVLGLRLGLVRAWLASVATVDGMEAGDEPLRPGWYPRGMKVAR